jgi:hypothetical protein
MYTQCETIHKVHKPDLLNSVRASLYLKDSDQATKLFHQTISPLLHTKGDTIGLLNHHLHHRHQQQEQPRPFWSSSLSGPSQSQLASWRVGLHPHHHQNHPAPLRRLQSPLRRGHLPLRLPRPLQRPCPWCAWSSSLGLQCVRRRARSKLA